MIKTLQKRFICSAMLAISILLIVLLGAINAGNLIVSNRQNQRTAEMLLMEETRMQLPPREDPPRELGSRPMDANAKMAAVFFIVRVDAGQNRFEVNTERIADISDEDAKALCREALAQNKNEGRVQGFLFRASESGRDGSRIFLFLDTSMQRHNILQVLLFSLIAGSLCWGAMLLLVILISKRAIRPIAENIERQKQFVTDAGHEIKTPLAIILANAEAMELYQGENKWLKNIQGQTQRLNGLMQNLLTLAKTDESRSITRMEELSFSEEISEAIQVFSEPMQRKELKLTAQIAPDVAFYADREQIRRLLSVLLDNAIRYAPQTGELRIALTREEKRLVFRIANQCERLPDCPPEKLFRRFYRSDAARTQESGGYGLGLSIAQTVVEAHKGTIGAAYSPPDWITFTVTFPSHTKKVC